MRTLHEVKLFEYANAGKTTEEKITAFLRDFPGATSSAILGATGLPYTTAMSVVQQLVEHKKVEQVREGKQAGYKLA